MVKCDGLCQPKLFYKKPEIIIIIIKQKITIMIWDSDINKAEITPA
jgi:hypothetical protein